MLMQHGLCSGHLSRRSNLQLSTRLTLANSSSLCHAWARPRPRPLRSSRIGRQLCCKASQSSQSGSNHSNEHRHMNVRIRVEEADTLESLASESGFSQATLQAANEDESELVAGEVLDFTAEVPEGMEVVTNGRTFRLEPASTLSDHAEAGNVEFVDHLQDGSNIPLHETTRARHQQEPMQVEQPPKPKADPESFGGRLLSTAGYVGTAAFQLLLVGAAATFVWNAVRLNPAAEEAAQRAAERLRNQGRAADGSGPVGSRLENPRVRAEMERRHGRSFLDHLDAEAVADEAEEVYQQQQQLRQAATASSTFTGHGNGSDALQRDKALRRQAASNGNGSDPLGRDNVSGRQAASNGNGSDALQRDAVLRRQAASASNASTRDASNAVQRDNALRKQAQDALGRSGGNGTKPTQHKAQQDSAFVAPQVQQSQQRQQQQQQQQKQVNGSLASSVPAPLQEQGQMFKDFFSRIAGAMPIVSKPQPASGISADKSQQHDRESNPVIDVKLNPESASSTSAPLEAKSQQHESESQDLQQAALSSPQHSQPPVKDAEPIKSPDLQRPALAEHQQHSQQPVRDAEPSRSMADAAFDTPSSAAVKEPEPKLASVPTPAPASATHSSAAVEEAEPSTSATRAESASLAPSSAGLEETAPSTSVPSPAPTSATPSSAAEEKSEPSTSGRDGLKEAAQSDMTHHRSPVTSQSASSQPASTGADLHTASSQKPSASLDSPERNGERPSRLDLDSSTGSPSVSVVQDESEGISSPSLQPHHSSPSTSVSESKLDWAQLPLPEDEPWFSPQPQEGRTQQPQVAQVQAEGPAPSSPRMQEGRTQQPQEGPAPSSPQPQPKGPTGPAPEPHWVENDVVFFATNAAGDPMNFHVEGQPEEDEASLLVFEEMEDLSVLVNRVKIGLGEELVGVKGSPISVMQVCEASNRPIAWFQKGVVARTAAIEDELDWLVELSFSAKVTAPSQMRNILAARPELVTREEERRQTAAGQDSEFSPLDDDASDDDEFDMDESEFAATLNPGESAEMLRQDMPSVVQAAMDATDAAVKSDQKSRGSDDNPFISQYERTAGIRADGNGPSRADGISPAGAGRNSPKPSTRTKASEHNVRAGANDAMHYGNGNGRSGKASANGNRAAAEISANQQGANGNGSSMERSQNGSSNGAGSSDARQDAYAAMRRRQTVPLSKDELNHLNQTAIAEPSSFAAGKPYSRSAPVGSSSSSTQSADELQPATASRSATAVVDRPQPASASPSATTSEDRHQPATTSSTATRVVDRPQSAAVPPNLRSSSGSAANGNGSSATTAVDRPQSAIASATTVADRTQSATVPPNLRHPSGAAANRNGSQAQQSRNGTNSANGSPLHAQSGPQQTAPAQEARSPVFDSASSSASKRTASTHDAKATVSDVVSAASSSSDPLQQSAKSSQRKSNAASTSAGQQSGPAESAAQLDYADSQAESAAQSEYDQAQAEVARMEALLKALEHANSTDSDPELEDENVDDSDMDMSNVARSPAEIDALFRKLEDEKAARKPPSDHWLKLKYVCLPEIHYPDGSVGLMTTDMAVKESDRDPHVLAFASRQDAEEAKHLLQANQGNQAGAQVRVKPIVPAELQQAAAESGHGVTVYYPGQLELVPGMTMEELAKAIERA